MQRRTLIAASATATLTTALRIDDTPSQGRLGMSDVQRVENTIHRLHAQLDAVGGGPLLGVSLAYLDRLRQAIDRCTYGPRVEQALYRQVSSLYSSAGWHARDSARQPQASHLFLGALQSALLTTDPLSQARAWGNLAMQTGDQGRHREAVQMARAGLGQRPDRLEARMTALLHTRLAVAQARTENTGIGRSILAAERAYDRADDSPTSWLAFLDPSALLGEFGSAHQYARNYRQAENATTQALTLMPCSRRRGRAICAMQLADIQLRQGNRDAARATVAGLDVSAVESRLITDRKSVV